MSLGCRYNAGSLAWVLAKERNASTRQCTAEDIALGDELHEQRILRRFRGIDLDKSLAKYPGAFLTVRGTKDFLPQRDDELLRIAPGMPCQKVVLEGADHIFNVFQPELGHAAQAVGMTVTWFEGTL